MYNEKMKQFNDEYLDDVTYIKDMRHFTMGPWQQYDVLLDSRNYNWPYMLDSADYMATADLKDINEVQTGDFMVHTVDITDSYHEHDNKCSETPELKQEQGFLSIAGNSEVIKAPVKIVWVNQTHAIRVFTLVEDELLIRKYVETVIRRSFGSENAMKLGKSYYADLTEFGIKTSLFIIPVAFEGEPEFTEEPDIEMHFGIREAQMLQIGSKLLCYDIPDGFAPAKAAHTGTMHYQTLKAPDGKRYMPLFTSYDQMTAIFGKNIRIGVICYDTAKEFVLKEDLAGIVVSPGTHNTIIKRRDLIKEGSFSRNNADDACDAMKRVDDLRNSINSGSVSIDELAGSVLEVDKCFTRCAGCRFCNRADESSPRKYITNCAHAVTDVLTAVDTEEYVDLINKLSDGLQESTEQKQKYSVIPELIDDYEKRMQNVLHEQSDMLRKIAGKMEWKIVLHPFSCRWVDGFIQKTEEWFRYVKPLIAVAAVRETENTFVQESVKCLERLADKALYDNDEAAYRLSNAFAGYFADMPSVMKRVNVIYELSDDHLKRKQRL